MCGFLAVSLYMPNAECSEGLSGRAKFQTFTVTGTDAPPWSLLTVIVPRYALGSALRGTKTSPHTGWLVAAARLNGIALNSAELAGALSPSGNGIKASAYHPGPSGRL